MNTEPRAAPPTVSPFAGGSRGVPGWAVKAVGQLNAGELAEALEYLERHRPDDDVLGRALAGEFARRTAAAEFADRAAAGRVSPPGTPFSPDASGSRRPGA